MKAIKSGSGAFQIPEVEVALKALGLKSIKASSTKKVDIKLRLPSLGGGQDLDLGFSIKSRLGRPSTLLNASKLTNFEYKLVGGSVNLEEVQGKKYYEIREILKARGIRLEYVSTKSDNFLNNLEFFGADFPGKLASMVENYFMEEKSSPLLTEHIEIWAVENGEQLAATKLRFQLKSFLRAVALGMTPGTVWSGDLEGYGGYIVIREDGELVCLHLENDDDFKSYLLVNARFDHPKDSLFNPPYLEGDQLRLSVNFQIRFVK